MDRTRKILICEDEEDLRSSMRTLFLAKGYEVVSAYNVERGIEKVHKEIPDLVMLDLGLPGGGGFKILENIKNSDKTKNIPVIVLTAIPLEETEEKAYKMGAAAYLHKPFSSPELIEKVGEVIGV